MVKVHVGLLVLTYLPSEKQLAAICRVRTAENMDGEGNTPKKQSYAGCYQVTCKGKPEEDKEVDGSLVEEAEENILPRTAARELGVCAMVELLAIQGKFQPQLLVERVNDKGIAQKTYIAYRPQLFRKLIQMDISGTPALVRENDLSRIHDIDRKADKDGVPVGVIKFFDDEHEALRLAFAKAKEVGIENLMPHFNRRMITNPLELIRDDKLPPSIRKAALEAKV